MATTLLTAPPEQVDICEHSTGDPCESCTEPRACERCDGSGYIEVRVGLAGLTERRCPGETDNDECDGGIVR